MSFSMRVTMKDCSGFNVKYPACTHVFEHFSSSDGGGTLLGVGLSWLK